jgi:tol-pal system-associated acyl-CoA thioesterase
MTHRFSIHIYYEDTDHSGVVYHANYLRFFERAREHMFGIQALVDLYKNDGIGFVVYQAQMQFKKGAEFGDKVIIRSTVTKESAYRLVFHQQAWKESQKSQELLVDAYIHLACVSENKKLVPLPTVVLQTLSLQEFFLTS